MRRLNQFRAGIWLALPLFSVLLGACASSRPPAYLGPPETPSVYTIGPGDVLKVYVRNNPDLTMSVPVRPDGRISIPLVQAVEAAGKTPQQLAEDIENALSEYIRQPVVTVIVTQSVGAYSDQVRVVGEAAQPQAMAYRQGMTLLDVLIAVGGLSPYADGNDAKIVRQYKGRKVTFPVDLEDLLQGDTSENVAMRPGDILIVPKSIF